MSENQNIEYKQSWHDDYLKWVCGFANASGGVLFIGKKDNGELLHVENYKQLMEAIPNKIRDLMGILCEVVLHELEGIFFIELKFLFIRFLFHFAEDITCVQVQQIEN